MTYQDILKQIGWPTQTLTIDFETYFDKDYTLKGKKLSLIEYVRDDRFDFTGVGCRINDSCPPNFIFKPYVKAAINFLQREYGKNFEKVTVIIQNAKFDALVLKEKFNINPPYIIDTKDLARYIDARMSHRLKDLAKMFELKPKGDTGQFEGLHYEDMDTNTKADLAAYCNNDVEIETELFQILLPQISTPEIELPIARHTLKLFLEPILELDAEKASALRQRMEMRAHIAAWSTGHTQKEIGGSLSFVKLLLDALPKGETIPVKFGKPTKNMIKLLGQPGVIPAFAKDDVEFQKLLIHPDEAVRTLCQARQAVKSWPLHIKRVTRLINQSKAWDGKLGVDLKYYGGHLGRWSGGGGVNLQNLGGRGRMIPLHPLIGEIKGCIYAPDGYVIPNADSAQVEARLLAWMAGQDDLVAAFAAGKDVYSEFATTLFRERVWKPDEKEEQTPGGKIAHTRRGFGKDAILGCVAFGTPILTNHGWKPIEKVILADKIWDGRDWVLHNGVCFKGKKSCINVKGVWVTPEHEILHKGVWFPAISLSTGNQESGIDTEALKLLQLSRGFGVGLSQSNVVAPVVESLLRQEIIWSPENLHAVMSVLKRHPVKLRLIRQLCFHHIKNDCLIEFVRSLVDAKLNRLKNMANEVLGCGPIGSEIELLFLNTWRHYQDGIIQNLRLTGLTIMEAIDQVILDSPPGSKILETADILYSGDFKRFQAGNIIVSNCGYGMGKDTFFERCLANPTLRPYFDCGDYNLQFIGRLINTYRSTYSRIPEYWKAVEKAFRWVVKYPHESISVGKLNFWNNDGVAHLQLPSGRELLYPDCRITKDGKYDTLHWKYGHLWGGTITENIIQAMGADLLRYWILKAEESELRVAHHIHDSIYCAAEEKWGNTALNALTIIMLDKPSWAEGLPLGVEGKISREL